MSKSTDRAENKDEAEKIAAAAEKAGRQARRLIDDYAPAFDGFDRLTTAIRDEPVKSLLIALGAGVILGMIVKR